MQQRRGLKQDLPKPLRPGEIGFATDSRQIYIGADTVDPVSDIYNKTGIFEKTSSAQSTTASLANVQMIKFTVPHKIYDKGEFDGVTDSINWSPTSNVASTSTDTNSRFGRVFGTNVQNFKNVLTGNVFVPTDLFVVKEGVTLSPSNVATIASGNDYFFAQTGNLSLNNHSHELTLRTPPSGAEAVSISYYGNSAIINAISNTTIGVSGVAGFYTAKTISSYRQLDEKNIRVTPGTGVGFIGMQFKHIQVATDVKVSPSDAVVNATGDLGNLFLTKNDGIVSGISAVYNSGNATISMSGNITADSYNPAGSHNHVFVAGGSDWLDNQILKVVSYDSANAHLVAELPSNTASLTRKIDAITDVSSNVQIQLPSIQDTEVGDSIYFWEPANISSLHQREATITDINTLTRTADLDLLYADVGNANVDVYAMVFKDGVNSNVVVNSSRHGLESGNSITIASGASPIGGSYVVETTGNVDTFVIDYGTSINSNIADLNFTPIVSSATVSATPVTTFDLSSVGSISDAKTIVNSYNLWPRLNNIPGDSSKLYITHAESVVKTPFAFSLHNDQRDTLTTLGLTDGEYTRLNATVKAKLEEWMDTVRDNTQLNLFKEIYANQEFAGPSFSTWDLAIDSALGEMNFESRVEARDFSQIVNNLYFEGVNPDIRGLLNIKTNIEFLTTEALAAGTATTSYTSPEQITIPAGGPNVVSELGLSLNDDYQTMVVEYSMQGGTASNTYRRVGTLMYSGDPLAGDVVFNDNYSDLSNGMTGNVSFTAAVGGANQLAVSVTNTLSPSTDLSMRYIVRRWGDS